MYSISQRRVFLYITFGSPHDDHRHSRQPSHGSCTECISRRNALKHFRVVIEMDRLTCRTARAIRLTRDVEAPPDLLGWKTVTQIILGDDRQVRPDAQQLLGIVNSSRLFPLGKGVRASPKIANLL